jgi:hypothetical protein
LPPYYHQFSEDIDYITNEAQRSCHNAFLVNTTSSGLATHETDQVQGTTQLHARVQRLAVDVHTSYMYIHYMRCAAPRPLVPCSQVAERTSSCCPTDTFLATGAEESACIRRHVSARGWGEPTLTANGVTSEGAEAQCHVILGGARWCDRVIFVCLSVYRMGETFRAF